MSTTDHRHTLDRLSVIPKGDLWATWKSEFDKTLSMALGKPASARRILAPVASTAEPELNYTTAAQDE